MLTNKYARCGACNAIVMTHEENDPPTYMLHARIDFTQGVQKPGFDLEGQWSDNNYWCSGSNVAVVTDTYVKGYDDEPPQATQLALMSTD